MTIQLIQVISRVCQAGAIPIPTLFPPSQPACALYPTSSKTSPVLTRKSARMTECLTWLFLYQLLLMTPIQMILLTLFSDADE